MRLSRLCIPLLAVLAACSDPASRSTAQTTQGISGPGLADPSRTPPPNLATMKMSFAPIVRRAAPAVVNVSARSVVRQQNPFFEMFGMGVPRARLQESLGSGAIVRPDGVIVTNNHVIEGAQQIRVALSDRREFPARVLLADARSDLAILKIDAGGERLPVLPIAPGSEAQVGDLVLAIGDPFGVGQTVTNGIVSGLARTELQASDTGYYIQTDAAINPGNSGGPLVDMNGNLLGINTFILSRSGSSSGVGFAIPAALVRRVVEQAVGGVRSVVRPWIGVQGQTVDANIARSIGLSRPQGVLAASIYPGSPAARAGLEQGDVILAADGQPVNDQATLNYVAATHRPGESVTLQVRHGASVRNLPVRLEPPPASPARDQRTLGGRQPLQGATVASLSPAVADEVGVDPFARGVLVLQPGTGIASQLGFQSGDIVQAVNGRPVASVPELISALGASQGWQVTILRNGQQITAQF